jgi:hypothetical protein
MTRRIVLLASAALLLPRLASACPVCFGASDGPMLEGSNMGILALLIVTLAMLVAFGAFFYTLARREARSVAAEPLHALGPLQKGTSR